MYMKKFYSIVSVLILSLGFSSAVYAQVPQDCAPGTITASIEGNTWPGATNCRIIVLAPEI